MDTDLLLSISIATFSAALLSEVVVVGMTTEQR